MRGALTFAVALACLAVGLPAPTRAQPGPMGEWSTLRVGVLPVRSYVRGPEDVFHERPQVRGLREASGLWQRRIEELALRRDQVEVVAAQQIRERLARTRTHREAADLAAERFALGVERYRELALEEALKHLDRAAELYRDADADAVLPRELADVELYRGLAFSESGDGNRAHIAFRDMYLLDPGRVLQKGYYPEATERAFVGAQLDLSGAPDKLAVRFPSDRLGALARRAQVDVWILALIEGTLEAPVLHLATFDRRTGALSTSDRIPLGDADVVSERVDRALSAWHTCATSIGTDGSMLRPKSAGRWGMEFGYVHTLVLRHRRTRELFHSPGLALGVTFDATKNVHLFGRALHMVSLPDRNADLFETFVTSRLALGGGLSGGTPDLRFFFEAGLELGLTLSDIQMTTDVDCKHFGSGHPRCTRLSTVAAPGVWLGLQVALGTRWRLSEAWYVHGSAMLSSYVLEADLAGDLNFPLGVGAGFGHRF